MTGSRRCPHCGETVPSYSLTCPRCYRDIPREDVSRETFREEGGRCGIPRDKSRTLTMILAAFLPLVGINGLCQIYRDHREAKGWFFLAAGLLLFWGLVFLIRVVTGSGWLGATLAFIAALIVGLMYISLYLAQLADAFFGSVFGVFSNGRHA